MAAYRRVDDLVTCRLTASTPGSAPGPTLGNEYGKPVSFIYKHNLDNAIYASCSGRHEVNVNIW